MHRCFHRFDIHYSGAPLSNENFSNNTSDSPHALNSEGNYTDQTPNSWVLDSGATNHMMNDEQHLNSKVDYKGKPKVTVGNDNSLSISHIGTNSVSTFDANKSLMLKDILHVPSLTKNLISIS